MAELGHRPVALFVLWVFFEAEMLIYGDVCNVARSLVKVDGIYIKK